MKDNKVTNLVNEIREGLTQQGSSLKDETAVMRAMLNDKEFSVDVYSNKGVVGSVCPYQESRDMITSVISKTTKIPTEEARVLAENHQFNNAESESMVTISKEFFNTYLDTGRKISLGKRERSDISFKPKEVEESVKTYPSKDDKGNFTKGEVTVPAHKSVKVSAPCPEWLKRK